MTAHATREPDSSQATCSSKSEGALNPSSDGKYVTVSGSGDQGADPNQLVSVTDRLSATALPAAERFFTVVPPRYDQVVRGVSFTPGTRR